MNYKKTIKKRYQEGWHFGRWRKLYVDKKGIYVNVKGKRKYVRGYLKY